MIKVGGTGSKPDNIPNPPLESGPVAGSVHEHGSGGSDGDRRYEGKSLTLRPGLYNYDDLKSGGLHDSISSIKVNPGFVVKIYENVDGGVPVGPDDTIVGPAKIPELRSFNGMENEISAIEVWSKQQSGGGGQNPPGNPYPPTNPTNPPTNPNPPTDQPGGPFPPSPTPGLPEPIPYPPPGEIPDRPEFPPGGGFPTPGDPGGGNQGGGNQGGGNQGGGNQGGGEQASFLQGNSTTLLVGGGLLALYLANR